LKNTPQRLQKTPIRRLNGVTYWVIDNPSAIHDFINTEIRKEWEEDARSEGRDPRQDKWLNTLSQRRWSLEIVWTNRIKLNPAIMNYTDAQRGYVFSESLAKRSKDLREEIEMYAMVIWPVIVRKEDMVLVDGYCRYATLKAMNINRIYAYLGIQQTTQLEIIMPIRSDLPSDRLL